MSGGGSASRREPRSRAYFGSPDHVPLFFAGSEVVEFSPSVELQQTMATIGRNLAEMKAAMAAGASG